MARFGLTAQTVTETVDAAFYGEVVSQILEGQAAFDLVVRYDDDYRGTADRARKAGTAALALVPLAIGGGEPGKEIQAPMALVVLGGLLTSTVLNMVVVPTLFARFGGTRAGLPGRLPPAPR